MTNLESVQKYIHLKRAYETSGNKCIFVELSKFSI